MLKRCICDYKVSFTNTDAFNIPVCDGLAVILFKGLQSIPLGAYLFTPGYGYYLVVGFDPITHKVTIQNTCVTGNADPGTLVPACTPFFLAPAPSGCAQVQSCISVSDTETLDLSYVDGVISGDVLISADLGNIITVHSDGLYAVGGAIDCFDVHNCLSAGDTETIDMSFDDTLGIFSADAIISPDADNALSVHANGLYATGGSAPLDPFPDWIPDVNSFIPIVTAYSERWAILYARTRLTTYTFGTLAAGTDKWLRGALAPNGAIYCPPFTGAVTILKIDTLTDTASTFDTPGNGDRAYTGAVLASNGFIYCVPGTATAVLKIDPATDTSTTFGALGAPTTQKWNGGVMAPNGMIYCAPFDGGTTGVLKIDPSTDTTSILGNNAGYGQPSVGPDGHVYCPYAGAGSAGVLKINTSTDTPSTFGSMLGDYWGSALALNGCIYCPPVAGTTIAKIDPFNTSVTNVGSVLSGSGDKWRAACTAPNGQIYCLPRAEGTVLTINPFNDTVSEWFPMSTNSMGNIFAPNGFVYGTPSGTDTVFTKMDTNIMAYSADYSLSRFFNK